MKVPVAVSLQSRDGSVTKDARVKNGIIEQNGDELWLRKRPGNQDFGLVRTGTAQLLYPWFGIKSIIGDNYNSQYTATTTAITAATRNTTWNPADKTANLNLTGSNLIATATAINQGARSAAGVSSGQWYFEMTITNIGLSVGLGIGNINKTLGLLGGANSILWESSTALIYTQSGNFTAGTFTTGDIIGIFYDSNIPAISFYKNGALIFTLSGIIYFPNGDMYALIYSNTGAIVAANFAGPFTYAPTSASTALVLNSPNLPFSAANTINNIATPRIFFKNAEFGWTATIAGTVTKIASANYPGNFATPVYTVPGIVYLDGYFFVMGFNGVIYNSSINDPTTWAATDTIVAQSVYGNGKALFRSLNYVIAFKDYSTEFFYNAAISPGSPLARVDNGFTLIGCANGLTVVQVNGLLIWVSQTAERGRAVHMMNGLDQKLISTPDVERIINADQLVNVEAIGVRLDGHNLYILTLESSNITLVYDLNSQTWSQWSALTIGNSVSVSSITRVDTTATVTTSGAHGLSDGDPVTISGAVQGAYNGIFQIQYLTATTFTYQVTGSPATPATGSILSYPYTETYFKYPYYANYNGYDLLLHETNGHIYQILSSLYQDAGSPINVDARSIKIDGQVLTDKSMNRMEIFCNTVSDSIMFRYTDDDYATYSLFKIVSLSTQRPNIRRLGSFRRRAFNVRYIGNNQLQISALGLGVEK